MNSQKRHALKKILLTEIISFVAIIILIITAINIHLQTGKITGLTESVLAKESVSYASEIYNWWSGIEDRVAQTADVYRNIPDLSYDDTLNMLLELTALDPDSQDIYIGYGKTGRFLDGSGWTPDASFVFTDRAWYKGALAKNGAIYTSEPYVDASTGKTCLACAIMLDDDVVLSSDINFDKVAEKLDQFKSSSDEAKFYIINKETKDILVSNVPDITGQTVEESSDPVMQGLSKIFGSLNTENSIVADKVVTTGTSAGKMMYAATDIRETSWIVVSAVPYTFVSRDINHTIFVTFAIAAVLLLLLAALLYFIINKYVNPVSTVTSRISDISQGNFTVTLQPEGNNEITTLSESLNEYIGSMRTMLLELANISKSMNASAGDCYTISNNLSSSNQSQGESIEKLNSTLSSMSQSIDEMARAATDLAQTSGYLTENAENIKTLCKDTMNSSANGREEMKTMTQNVNTLGKTMQELTELIRTTARSIEEITGITDVINAISAQTDLLSLNASIEAARAGEQGRGFAVVASEVGSLARQSTEATDTIHQLIINITQNIEEINDKAAICMQDMEVCISGVQNANRSFETICNDVAKTTDGIMEIAEGIERISDVAKDNAATTEEQAATVDAILGLSDQIVAENSRILSETDSIANISANLNEYSDTIKTNLAKYTLS